MSFNCTCKTFYNILKQVSQIGSFLKCFIQGCLLNCFLYISVSLKYLFIMKVFQNSLRAAFVRFFDVIGSIELVEEACVSRRNCSVPRGNWRIGK